MPRIPAPHCPHPGCSNRGICPDHGWKHRTARKYDQRAWRDLSRRIRRDRPTCETPGCNRPTEHVDHIDGNQDNDTEANLQALCASCHSIKGHAAGELHPPSPTRRGPHHTTPTTLVAGPPASGKTTYVRDRAQPGDLIVDYDTLYQAVSNLPPHDRPPDLRGFVLDARDAILTRLEIRPGEAARAWIIHSAPRAEQRIQFRHRFDADVVVLLPPQQICIERAEARDGDWADTIAAWYRDYEPSPSDQIVRSGGGKAGRNSAGGGGDRAGGRGRARAQV